ncbi:MAG: DUF5658 family protein [Planctomycetota bacterium]
MRCCSRPRRVAVLLAGIVVLSVADLVVTMAHLKSTGMLEANPIAAFLIRSTESASVLALYKAVTVGISVSLLYRLRRHLAGELAAWCAVGILTGMSVMWHSYTQELDAAEHLELAGTSAYGEDWLVLD